MEDMATRKTSSVAVKPSSYEDQAEIRGQVYKRLDPIQVIEHDCNGGLLEAFIFKGYDPTADVVDVWAFEMVKGGIVLDNTRSFRPDRVRTDQEQRESKMAKSTAVKERARAARAPRTGVCEFTGQATKGGRFLPGRDAALKGALLAAARGTNEDGSNGDVQAAAELIARGWPTKDVHKSILSKAKPLATEELVERRVKARLAKVAKGTDPWEAASGLKAA